MLNPKFKAKWVAMLESGEYQQSVGILYDGAERYCCLGVACIAAGAKFKKPHAYSFNNPIPLPIYKDESLKWFDQEVLNSRGLELTGLSDVEQSVLAGMNDEGKTFQQIADYIKTTL